MEYILSLSYGKDSMACLEAIKQLGLPLDRIIHAEVWATDTIPADLPPMVEFKKKADKIILERYGVQVEHICATRGGQKLSYERQFYTQRFNKRIECESIYGFPIVRGMWCNSMLKVRPIKNGFREMDIRKRVLSCPRTKNKKHNILPRNNKRVSQYKDELVYKPSKNEYSEKIGFYQSPGEQGANKNIVQYIGIASDETERIERHTKDGFILPLVEIGWNEEYCRKWCEENDLLSPIYTDSARGGCWFCHNQGVGQLRMLRKKYPDLWELLLKWDLDSPVTFKANGHTVHDYDRRFAMEDEGLIIPGERFLWKMLDEPIQTRLIL